MGLIEFNEIAAERLIQSCLVLFSPIAVCVQCQADLPPPIPHLSEVLPLVRSSLCSLDTPRRTRTCLRHQD
jgi:hypothetical protein